MDRQDDTRPQSDADATLRTALQEALAALAPFAARCEEAVRSDDTDRDGVTVRTGYLRAARDTHAKVAAALAACGGKQG